MSDHIHSITYDGETIDCPICVHPERHEIEVMMQSGRSNQDVGDRYGITPAFMPKAVKPPVGVFGHGIPDRFDRSGHESVGEQLLPDAGEFIRRHRTHLPPRPDPDA